MSQAPDPYTLHDNPGFIHVCELVDIPNSLKTLENQLNKQLVAQWGPMIRIL